MMVLPSPLHTPKPTFSSHSAYSGRRLAASAKADPA